MDPQILCLKALVRYAGKLPENLLPHLGTLAHIGIFLPSRPRRHFFLGLSRIFSLREDCLAEGLTDLLKTGALDESVAKNAIEEAVQLRQHLSTGEMMYVALFFAELRKAKLLRTHFHYVIVADPLDPADEEALDSIFQGNAFLEGGIVSQLAVSSSVQVTVPTAPMSLPIRSIPPPAAPKRTLGRPKDTTDIAVFINDLRIKGKSWKATWVACKEQFHGRITAREKQGKEQVRSMWERHFAGKK